MNLSPPRESLVLIETLRILLAVALLVVVPGVLLVNALLPPPTARLRRSERAALGVTAGMLLLMLVGVVLGFLPHGERGSFSTFATGFPHVEIVTVSLAAILFWVGAQRGAYPSVTARWPRLAQPVVRFGTRRAPRLPETR